MFYFFLEFLGTFVLSDMYKSEIFSILITAN